MAEPQHYPECEKLAKVAPQSQTLEEFLEWLCTVKGLVLFSEEKMIRRYDTTESLLAEFFDIDMTKVVKERRQMIVDLAEFFNIDMTKAKKNAVK